MKLDLDKKDRGMLSGDEGEGVRMAMRILTRMAPVYGATRLLDISAAHIDSSVYMGPATLEFAERLVELGARVRVPSTLNVSGVDERGHGEWPVPADWAEGSRRQMRAYEAMGCIPTWTCAPYQTEHRPVFGQQIASGESNAIAFFNSVIGARTERYPDLLDICCAVTGRAPLAGLHTDGARAARYVLRLDDVPESVRSDDAFWPVLGYLIGSRAPNGVTAVTGIPENPGEDRLKALGAAAASAGAVGMFHLVGITPEAPTLEAATRGMPVERDETVTVAELRAARDALSTTDDDGLDVVLLGSPHFSYDEFRRFAEFAAGRKRHPEVDVVITCSRAMRDLVDRTPIRAAVDAFGAKLTVDTCPLVSPMLPERHRRLMTNSAKYAFYAPGLLGTSVRFGSLADCVESAVSGRVAHGEDAWNES